MGLQRLLGIQGRGKEPASVLSSGTCIRAVWRRHWRRGREAFVGGLPVLEGDRLAVQPLHEAVAWRFGEPGPQGCRQGDCVRCCNGWKSPEGSSRSPPQSDWQHRWGWVTSAADFEAVNAALGRALASAPTSKVMDVYNAFASITSSAVPN